MTHDQWLLYAASLKAERDELLEALKGMVALYDGVRDVLTSGVVRERLLRADAALANVEATDHA